MLSMVAYGEVGALKLLRDPMERVCGKTFEWSGSLFQCIYIWW